MPDLKTATKRRPVNVPEYFRPLTTDCPLFQRLYDAHLVARTIEQIAFEMSDEDAPLICSCAAVLSRHLWTLLDQGDECRSTMGKSP